MTDWNDYYVNLAVDEAGDVQLVLSCRECDGIIGEWPTNVDGGDDLMNGTVSLGALTDLAAAHHAEYCVATG